MKFDYNENVKNTPGRVKQFKTRIVNPTPKKLRNALERGIRMIIEADRNPVHALREALYHRAIKIEHKINADMVEALEKKTKHPSDYTAMNEDDVKYWNEQFDKKTILK